MNTIVGILGCALVGWLFYAIATEPPTKCVNSYVFESSQMTQILDNRGGGIPCVMVKP